MEGSSAVFMVLIALFVAYKLGIFGAIMDLTSVANRESAAYNAEHKAKVAKRYLAEGFTFTDEEQSTIKSNRAAIDALDFE